MPPPRVPLKRKVDSPLPILQDKRAKGPVLPDEDDDDDDPPSDPLDWDDAIENDSEVSAKERIALTHLKGGSILPDVDASPTHASPAEQKGIFNPISDLRSASACSSTVPMTQIPVNGKHLLTLWDTGASFCVLSAIAAQKLFGDFWESRLCRFCFLPTFELADGSKTKSKGRITVPLQFGRTTYHQDFFVLESHSVPAILGVDFFTKIGVSIDFGKSLIRLANMKNCPPLPFKISKNKTSFRGSLSPIFLMDTLEIKSGEQVLARGRVSKSDPLANLPPVPGVVTRIRRGTDPRHCCSNAVSTLRNSTINIQLANLTSLTSVVRKGAIVGYFQAATILSPLTAASMVFDEDDNVVDIREMTGEVAPTPVCDTAPMSTDPSDESNPPACARADLRPTARTSSAQCATACTRPSVNRETKEGSFVPASGRDPVSRCQDRSDRREQDTTGSLAPLYVDAAAAPPEDSPIVDGLPQDLDLSEAKKLLTPKQFQELRSLLVEHNDVFARRYAHPGLTDKVQMHIEVDPGVQPHFSPIPRWNPKQKLILIDWTNKLLEAKIVQPSDSLWNSSLLFVPKKDGKLRCVQNLKHLNSVTKPMPSTLPRIQDCFDCMNGAKWWSSCDMASAYHSIGLAEDSRHYTAFSTPLGRYEWTRAPMGCLNSQQVLVSLTNYMLSDLLFNSVVAYSDDLLCFSPTWEQHLIDLRVLLQRVRHCKLTLSAKKCAFATNHVSYCGYVIDEKGLHLDPKSSEAIRKMPLPKNLKELRSFIGMCSWWRRYIPHFAKITEALRPLLQKGNFRLPLSDDQVAAIQRLKDSLEKPPILAHPDFDKQFELHCDGSPTGIGCALMQMVDGKRVAVCYFSRSLTPAQQGYSQIEIETLAVLTGLEVFRSYFIGSLVQVYTDSEALTYIAKPDSALRGRQLRWQLRLSEYRMKLNHRRGSEHPVPDCLSRLHNGTLGPSPKIEPEPLYAARVLTPSTSSVPGSLVSTPSGVDSLAVLPSDVGPLTPLTLHPLGVKATPRACDLTSADAPKVFHEHQLKDDKCKRILALLRAGCPCPRDSNHAAGCAKAYYRVDSVSNLILRVPPAASRETQRRPAVDRVYVPWSLITSVLYHYHGLPITGHVGRNRTRNNISRKFYWPGFTKHVGRWIKACVPCQRRKARANRNNFQPGSLLARSPMHMLAIDFVGELYCSSQGNKWILTAIDVFTRYPFAMPLPDRKAETVARALFENIFQYHSFPQYLVTDNAGEFVGEVMKSLCRCFNISRIRTLPYTPTLNSCLENFHRYLNSTLTILTDRFKQDWDECVPLAMLAFRTSTHETTGYSPFMSMHGRAPRSDMDLAFPIHEPVLSMPQYTRTLVDRLTDIHGDIRTRQARVAEASIARRETKMKITEFHVGDLVLVTSAHNAEKLPGYMTRVTKLLDKNAGPYRIIRCVGIGPRRKYVVLNDVADAEEVYQPSRLILYTPWMDSLPSIPARRGFTSSERRTLQAQQDKYLPPSLSPGLLTVFPRTMPDGSPGFGVGRVLDEREPDSWNLHWYGNDEEELLGTYRPCWVKRNNQWYAANGKTCPTHKAMTTRDWYKWNICQDRCADVGFTLHNHLLPDIVLERISQHRRFGWTRS